MGTLEPMKLKKKRKNLAPAEVAPAKKAKKTAKVLPIAGAWVCSHCLLTTRKFRVRCPWCKGVNLFALDTTIPPNAEVVEMPDPPPPPPESEEDLDLEEGEAEEGDEEEAEDYEDDDAPPDLIAAKDVTEEDLDRILTGITSW